MQQHAQILQQRPEPVDVFTLSYDMEAGSRHNQVLDRMKEQEKQVLPAASYRDGTEFGSAEEYIAFFHRIIDTGAAGSGERSVVVSEFYLYDATGWRDETVTEVDVARFDRETRIVHCTESKGRNLEHIDIEEERQHYPDLIAELEDANAGRTAIRKAITRQKALAEGREALDRLQRYMDRFDWEVTGRVAVFFQHGNRGNTEVELYLYSPGDGI